MQLVYGMVWGLVDKDWITSTKKDLGRWLVKEPGRPGDMQYAGKEENTSWDYKWKCVKHL